ncbi:hypothetical protein PMAYCL1PPCAC_27877, partial [Pristionchus mayeri]
MGTSQIFPVDMPINNEHEEIKDESTDDLADITEVQPVMKILATSQKKESPRCKCDLCGRLVNSFCLSPNDPALSQLFIKKLIQLTKMQRDKIETIINHGECAVVCWRHMRLLPLPRKRFAPDEEV